MQTPWEKAQVWERAWHDSCINSLHEEEKQLVYAEKMGLVRSRTPKTPYNFDLKGASVLDIGGGAYSLLLKCVNYGKVTVVDPLMDKYPEWVTMRYEEANILANCVKGEELDTDDNSLVDFEIYDECWIYNVLEHTEDPEKVIQNAKKHGKIIRIFEWIETSRGVNVGHIHSFTEERLNECLGGEGKVEYVRRSGAVGKCFYGVFKGLYYDPSNC